MESKARHFTARRMEKNYPFIAILYSTHQETPILAHYGLHRHVDGMENQDL
jgi:hypothetical protein